MNQTQAVFVVLAAVALIAAVGVVAFGDRPVRSALSLVLNFFVLALLYFLLGAQLLGISQIMVYAGAIMVLFLFVIMMLQLSRRPSEERKGSDPRVLVAWAAGAGLAAVVLTAVVPPLVQIQNSPVGDDWGRPQAIGRVLFSTYVWPFEVSSVLLLVGIVGSILLAKRRL
jgi:NADH-quinone oxidoreductase subunit J